MDANKSLFSGISKMDIPASQVRKIFILSLKRMLVQNENPLIYMYKNIKNNSMALKCYTLSV